jgi:hypothetical protein
MRLSPEESRRLPMLTLLEDGRAAPTQAGALKFTARKTALCPPRRAAPLGARRGGGHFPRPTSAL